MKRIYIEDRALEQSFHEHHQKWQSCKRCAIAAHRGWAVFVRGRLPADVLFIGEAPGIAEDALGKPFVGPAGQLLDKWLSYSGMYTYAITNLIACRPTDCIGGSNRQPTADEILHCHDRLVELIYMARPKLVIAVGRVAESQLPHLTAEIASFNATTATIRHPSYVLRCGGEGSDADRKERKWLKTIIRTYL